MHSSLHVTVTHRDVGRSCASCAHGICASLHGRIVGYAGAFTDRHTVHPVHKKTRLTPGLRLYCCYILFTCRRSVELDSITHVSQEVLEITILFALRLEWLGTNLLVTTTETTVQCTQVAPL